MPHFLGHFDLTLPVFLKTGKVSLKKAKNRPFLGLLRRAEGAHHPTGGTFLMIFHQKFDENLIKFLMKIIKKHHP